MMDWRAHFGLAEETETVQSITPPARPRAGDEHSRAIALLLLVMAICCGALIYGIARGF